MDESKKVQTMESSPRSHSADLDFSGSTDVLELVRSVWRDVLDFEPDDDIGFFDSGGDSHLLFVLVDRLSKASGQKLKTIEVLKADTVSGQADLLIRLRQAQPENSTDDS
ncbi:phosphopantetheine-binding protein [Micromonospora sp. NPDC005686]|uniref:phosphopantetheine-binding protein n=1 Tax=unclassified Micromonospora TaxID=2617518 RepID=UPI0033B5BDBC